MRVAKNNFLVEVDSQFVQPKIKGFFIDTDFNPKLLSTKIGRIHSLSVGVYAPNRYDNPLSVGSEVVFGHLVCLDKNRVKDNVFMCPYHSIFAEIKNEELFPLEDILFCEPIKEDDYKVGAYLIEGKVSGTRAKVFKVSKYADSVGIKVNDIVYFTKNADYVMDIIGKELYMMRVRNIIGIERDGELMTFGNKLLVKNVTTLGKTGNIQKIYAQTNLQVGIVINGGDSGIAKDEKITYMNGVASVINWKSEDYAFIDERHIKFIL